MVNSYCITYDLQLVRENRGFFSQQALYLIVKALGISYKQC